MTEECILCGKPGGLHLTCGPLKTGPYCSDHRWKLGSYIDGQKDRMMVEKFNDWVSEFQSEERRKIDDGNS